MHAFTFSATDPALYMVLVLGGLNLRCLANFKSGSRLGCGNAEMKSRCSNQAKGGHSYNDMCSKLPWGVVNQAPLSHTESIGR